MFCIRRNRPDPPDIVALCNEVRRLHRRRFSFTEFATVAAHVRQAIDNMVLLVHLGQFGLRTLPPSGEIMMLRGVMDIMEFPDSRNFASFERRDDVWESIQGRIRPDDVGGHSYAFHRCLEAFIDRGGWVNAEFGARLHRVLDLVASPIPYPTIIRGDDRLSSADALRLANFVHKIKLHIGLFLPDWSRDPETLSRLLPDAGECILCLDAPANTRSCVFQFDMRAPRRVCDHKFCRPCLRAYLAASYKRKKMIVACPDPYCHVPMLGGDARRIGGLDLVAQAPTRPVDHFVANTAGVMGCPSCGVALLKDGGSSVMTCICGQVFDWTTKKLHGGRHQAGFARDPVFGRLPEMVDDLSVRDPVSFSFRNPYWKQTVVWRQPLMEMIHGGRWATPIFVQILTSLVQAILRPAQPDPEAPTLSLTTKLSRGTRMPRAQFVGASPDEIRVAARDWVMRNVHVRDVYVSPRI